jgi:hypothetical protein
MLTILSAALLTRIDAARNPDVAEVSTGVNAMVIVSAIEATETITRPK